MPKKPNHTCVTCGATYYNCDGCASMGAVTPWRSIACSVECYQAFLTVKELQAGRVTKAEADEMIQRSGFDTNKALPSVREALTPAPAETSVSEVTPVSTPAPTKKAKG